MKMRGKKASQIAASAAKSSGAAARRGSTDPNACSWPSKRNAGRGLEFVQAGAYRGVTGVAARRLPACSAAATSSASGLQPCTADPQTCLPWRSSRFQCCVERLLRSGGAIDLEGAVGDRPGSSPSARLALARGMLQVALSSAAPVCRQGPIHVGVGRMGHWRSGSHRGPRSLGRVTWGMGDVRGGWVCGNDCICRFPRGACPQAHSSRSHERLPASYHHTEPGTYPSSQSRPAARPGGRVAGRARTGREAQAEGPKKQVTSSASSCSRSTRRPTAPCLYGCYHTHITSRAW